MAVTAFHLPLSAGGFVALAPNDDGTVKVRLEFEAPGGCRQVAEGSMTPAELDTLSSLAAATGHQAACVQAGKVQAAGCAIERGGPPFCAAARCRCSAEAWGA